MLHWIMSMTMVFLMISDSCEISLLFSEVSEYVFAWYVHVPLFVHRLGSRVFLQTLLNLLRYMHPGHIMKRSMDTSTASCDIWAPRALELCQQ